MKKTIIAASIAAVVAAPAAFADVSISGFVLQEYDFEQDNNTGGTSGAASAADINFAASEDLGNGMKAFAKMGFSFDNGTIGSSTNDEVVGISGDFGTFSMGRMEPYLESKVAGAASIGALAETASIENDQKSTKRVEGVMRYSLPSFNGLTVTIEGANEIDTNSGASSAGSQAGDDFAMTAIAAKYSNGGLTVNAVAERNEGANDIDAIAVIYKMGDLEGRVVHQASETNAGVDHDSTVYGVKYTMGANQFGIGKRSTDTADADDMIVGVTHNLSKNTAIGLTHVNGDVSTSDKTIATLRVKF